MQQLSMSTRSERSKEQGLSTKSRPFVDKSRQKRPSVHETAYFRGRGYSSDEGLQRSSHKKSAFPLLRVKKVAPENFRTIGDAVPFADSH